MPGEVICYWNDLNLTSNEGEYNHIQMGNIYKKSTKIKSK